MAGPAGGVGVCPNACSVWSCGNRGGASRMGVIRIRRFAEDDDTEEEEEDDDEEAIPFIHVRYVEVTV